MVLTTLPRAAPRRVPATPRKEAATAALRVASTLAMTWAALRLSPRLPLINRPLCLVSPPLSQRGIHGRGAADVLPDPTELMRDTRCRESSRGTSPQIAGLPVPRAQPIGRSPGRSRSAGSPVRRPTRSHPAPYVTSALCRGMTVQRPAAAATGGHGRRPPGRSGENFLTGVSIIEMRHGARAARGPSYLAMLSPAALSPAAALGAAGTVPPPPRPPPPPPPPAARGPFRAGRRGAGAPPAGPARTPGGVTVGG